MSSLPKINRRTMLTGMTGAAAALAIGRSSASTATKQRITGMGLVIYDCNLRRRWLQKQNASFNLFEPLTFLKHCQSLGAGGMQTSLGVLSPAKIAQLREYAEKHDLYIEGIVGPPKEKSDLARFEAQIKTAAEVGVKAARTVIMPGRRYEQFKSLDLFRETMAIGQKMLERAAPIVEKYQVPFAVENHKDQRIEQRIELFEHLNSEYIGACVDTGNSFALLDDAYGTIADLAPFAFSIHLKDQALRLYDEGFLLGDIPLGQGSFDLKKMVATLQNIKPNVRFSLELITRDPLKVPCLTDDYWRTMPKLPAKDLARTLRFVRENTATDLQQVSSLSAEKQVELEDANVAASIKYAGKQLGI